jgi:hypothetical protein
MATISSVVFAGILESTPQLAITPDHTRSAIGTVLLPGKVRVRVKLSGVSALVASSYRAGVHVGVFGTLAMDEQGLYVESESMVRWYTVVKGMPAAST